MKNRVALITGSVTGIGEAIARAFAGAGARVMIHGRPAELDRAKEVVASITANTASGGTADYHLAELGEPAQCAELIAATIERFGRIDTLVNNAATTMRSNLETTSVADFDYVMAVNLRAPLLLIQAALPHFRKIGGGCVLNIGSVNGYCGEQNLLVYSLSKGGLMTLSRNLADAHGREGIRVIHFNVGWVLTPNEYALKIREGMPADWPEHIPPVFAPSGRLLSPETIAHYALAYVSDEAGAVNGAVVELEQYPIIGRNPVKSV